MSRRERRTKSSRRLRALGILLLLASGPLASGSLEAQEISRAPGQAEPLRISVEDAVARAVARNEDVSMARAERTRLAGLATEVRSRALPELDLDFNFTRNLQTPVLFFNTPDGVQQIQIGSDNDYTLGFTFRAPLLDLTLGPAQQAARLSRVSSDAGVEATRTTVATDTRVAYYTVLRDRSLVEVQEQALAEAQSRLEQVRKFYEAGTASEFDLLTAEVEVENIRPQLIQARNDLALARDRLKRQMGISLDREIETTDSLAGPVETPSLEEALRVARDHRADLDAQRTQVELQEVQVTVENRSSLPTLSALASFQRRASSDDLVPPNRDFSQTATAGFSLTLPILDGRARAGQVQQARAELERERFRLQQLDEVVALEVKQAYLSIDAARQQIETSRANVRRAEEALRIAQARFRNGLSEQVELNDAQLALTQARTNYTEALFQFNVARAQLTGAMGQR